MSLAKAIESIDREAFGRCVADIDCNECVNINFTEEEQRESGNHNPHVCQKYNKRCLHMSAEKDAVVIYPCKECVSDDYKFYNGKELSLLGYAESISPFPLSNFQKELIEKYDKILKQDQELYVLFGKEKSIEIVRDVMGKWESQNLVDHRCTCGRLLGKFNGQAEVKCQKCGKVNMIGGNQA